MIVSKNHISLSTSQEVINLTKPLKSIGITYFCYSKSYSDGGRIYLDADSEELEKYLEFKHYLFGNTEGIPSSYKAAQIVLWNTLPNQFLYDSLRNKGIGNGIFMIVPYGEFCEFYGFAGDINNSNLYNNYLTNTDLLKKFIEYFKEKAAPILKKSEADKIYLPYHNRTINSVTVGSMPEIFAKNNQSPKLTVRQLSCSRLLLAGRTCKEMGRELGLSTRTIESYINNLKTKFSCNSKTELIIKLNNLFSVG